MGLTISTPPQESLNALEAASSQFSSVIDISGALHSGSPETTLPHQVFTIGLTDLANGSRLDNAVLVGWRFLLGNVAAEVNAPSYNSEGVSLNEGPFVQQTADLVARASASRRVENGTYELAVLRIPGIYVMALWLKSGNSKDDIFIPMKPTLEELEPGREYGVDEFTSILVNAAQARLAFDDAPQT